MPTTTACTQAGILKKTVGKIKEFGSDGPALELPLGGVVCRECFFGILEFWRVGELERQKTKPFEYVALQGIALF